MELTPKEKVALWNRFSRKAAGILGRPVKIRTTGTDELGYTSEGGEIMLAAKHPIFDDLPLAETVMFVTGVFAHEVMHQVLTDFAAMREFMEKRFYPESAELRVYHAINNVLEDSHIEHYAPQFIGGSLLGALRYTRAVIYAKSPGTETAGSPFGEFMSASIHFGDGGFVKGRFNSPEAKRCFEAALPFMVKGIKETDAKKRLSLSLRIMNIAKPLWEPEIKRDELLNKLLNNLTETLTSNGRGSDTGGASGESASLGMPADKADAASPVPKSPVDERRDKTAKEARLARKKAKEEAKAEAEAEAESGGPPRDAEGNPAADGDGRDDNPENGEEPEHVSSPDDGDERGDAPNNGDGPGDAVVPNGDGGHENKAPDDGDDADGTCEEPSLSDEERAETLRELFSAEAEEERKERNEKEKPEPYLELDTREIVKKRKDDMYNVRARNIEPGPGDEMLYDAVSDSIKADVGALSSQLLRILKSEIGEKTYTQSGRIDADRTQGTRLTARMFTRRREKTDKSDTAVVTAVDMSGSMEAFSNYKHAMTAAIGLAEVFAECRIPAYIFGFSADGFGSGSVELYHFVRWGNNTKRGRMGLTEIRPKYNNFDGYAIRYAQKLLDKRGEAQKIMIVVSDGLPACRVYGNSGSEGVKDTKSAIREAKAKGTTVVGVLMGNEGLDKERVMYDGNFLHVTKPKDLFQSLGKSLKKMIRDRE